MLIDSEVIKNKIKEKIEDIKNDEFYPAHELNFEIAILEDALKIINKIVEPANPVDPQKDAVN